MRYFVLCCDYDGTLATEGEVFPQTAKAVERLLASGRRAVLVTGRELDELKTVCHCLHLFEYVVAENGALLYQPSTNTETPLAQRPPDSFVATLRERGVERVSVGRVIVATWEPWETVVLQTIRDHGLELQVIFNKGAVMILPAGVNKASGLAAALERMGLSRHNAVGVGDAENDHALLGMCEFGAAVANALPTLKEHADLVTSGARGAGVEELIGELLQDDLASHEAKLARHELLLAHRRDGSPLCVRPHGESVTLLGPAGAARKALAARLLEQLSAASYSFCLVDPAGEFATLARTVSLGTSERAPTIEEVLKLLRRPEERTIVNLSALPGPRAVEYLNELLPQLSRLRAGMGLPHWLGLDVGEQLPALQPQAGQIIRMPTRLLIAEDPSTLGQALLAATNLLLVMGESAVQTFQTCARLSGKALPADLPRALRPDEAFAWRMDTEAAPVTLQLTARG